MAQITDLPPEILTMIFKNLHYDAPPSSEVRLEHRHAARTMHARLLPLLLLNKTWRAVLQDTSFPEAEISKFQNRTFNYGWDEDGFWYFISGDTSKSSYEMMYTKDNNYQKPGISYY